jgi:hypothetical protein
MDEVLPLDDGKQPSAALLVEGRAAFADILRWNLQRSGFVVEYVG